MIYEVDSASLDAAGSSVYGSVLVKVTTPLPGVAAEEEVVAPEETVLVDEPHPANRLTKININASDKNNIFFKADLPFLFCRISDRCCNSNLFLLSDSKYFPD